MIMNLGRNALTKSESLNSKIDRKSQPISEMKPLMSITGKKNLKAETAFHGKRQASKVINQVYCVQDIQTIDIVFFGTQKRVLRLCRCVEIISTGVTLLLIEHGILNH